MSRVSAAALVVVISILVSAYHAHGAAPTAATPTAEELLERYAKAIGGRDKLKAVQTLRMQGKMAAGGGFMATYLLELKRPGAVRTELSFSGTTAIQASDGTKGWVLRPAAGQAAPTPIAMTPQQMQDLEQTADIDGPLIDTKAKGYTVELVGKETVGNVTAWNLKVTDKHGIVRNFYLDSLTYFPIKQVVHKTTDGKDVESEMRLGDYREVSGLRYPYLLESANKTGPGGQRLVLDKIEVNPPLGADRFAMPAAPAKPAAKP